MYCSYPNYQDYRDRNTVFSGLALYTPIQATLDRRRPDRRDIWARS